MASVNLTYVDTWLFDLDNTLYPPSSGYILAIVALIW